MSFCILIFTHKIKLSIKQQHLQCNIHVQQIAVRPLLNTLFPRTFIYQVSELKIHKVLTPMEGNIFKHGNALFYNVAKCFLYADSLKTLSFEFFQCLFLAKGPTGRGFSHSKQGGDQLTLHGTPSLRSRPKTAQELRRRA